MENSSLPLPSSMPLRLVCGGLAGSWEGGELGPLSWGGRDGSLSQEVAASFV